MLEAQMQNHQKDLKEAQKALERTIQANTATPPIISFASQTQTVIAQPATTATTQPKSQHLVIRLAGAGAGGPGARGDDDDDKDDPKRPRELPSDDKPTPEPNRTRRANLNTQENLKRLRIISTTKSANTIGKTGPQSLQLPRYGYEVRLL